MLKSLLAEAKKTQTKTIDLVAPSTESDSMDDAFDRHFKQMSSVSRDKSPAAQARQSAKLSRAVSSSSTARGRMPAINHDALSDIAAHEEMRDTHHEQTGDDQPVIDNALATTTKAVRGAGKIHADWMGVDQLPGYMQNGIRAMGRIVFNPLTKTKLEDINILANLNGHGPHDAIEINAVANFARKHATETRDLSMTFGEVIPGYAPEAKLFITPHDTYLVIQDDMGRYIYNWKSKDTKPAFIKKLK